MTGEVARRVPASTAQRLLWLLERFRGGEGAVNCPIVLRLRGPLDEARLRTGLTALTARHESLRTTFEGRGRSLTQLVHPPGPVLLRRVDLAGHPDVESRLRAAVRAEIREPIDAGDWPVRHTLWRLGSADHALCVNMHHAVTDGWSCGLVLRDLDRLTRADGPPLPPVGWQYPQASEWHHAWLDSAQSRAERAYWRDHLAGARLPRIPLRPPVPGGERAGGNATGDIGAGVVDGLRRLARARRTTLAAVLLAVYYHVLGQVTGDDDLAVASFLANRGRPEVRETVGLLANMVVLRTRLCGAGTGPELIRRAHETVMNAFVHQRLPYQLLPADTIADRDRRPDDVMFQIVPEQRGPHAVAGATAEVVVLDELGTRFECEFQLYPRDGGMRAVLLYNRARLDPGWAAALVRDYVDAATRFATAG
jgi:hypothetical protein